MSDGDELNKVATLGKLLRLRLPFDLETPTSVFIRVADSAGAFLLESIEGGINLGRYSFIGCDPVLTVKNNGQGWTVQSPNGHCILPGRTLAELRPLLALCHPGKINDLPPMAAGLVGYFGYDLVRAYEPLGAGPEDDLRLPKAYLTYPGILYVLDHINNTIDVIVRGDIYCPAEVRLEKALAILHSPIPRQYKTQSTKSPDKGFYSNTTEDAFKQMVIRAKEHIRAGDIFQVVLSQRLTKPLKVHPTRLYRTLRRINPSPYMFCLNCDDGLYLIGSSPEMLVRLRNGIAEQRPLAGTRKRGSTQEEDSANIEDLLRDEKEIAEHVMLVDLARNDLGRVCAYGTVTVPEVMQIEKFSHVMHIVSHVCGQLRDDCDAIDLLSACLPAGTVSGAPKVRAMQIIDDLELTNRGPYAGAVGYIDPRGNMDTCIAIRTIMVKNNQAYVQAGAGIVADSIPANEYQETLNKAKALLMALDIAAQEPEEV